MDHAGKPGFPFDPCFRSAQGVEDMELLLFGSVRTSVLKPAKTFFSFMKERYAVLDSLRIRHSKFLRVARFIVVNPSKWCGQNIQVTSNSKIFNQNETKDD